MRDEIYEIVVQLVSGCFTVPVKHRTTTHRTAIAYHIRHRHELSLNDDDPPLLYLGERILHCKSVLCISHVHIISIIPDLRPMHHFFVNGISKCVVQKMKTIF